MKALLEAGADPARNKKHLWYVVQLLLLDQRRRRHAFWRAAWHSTSRR